ncbi:phosphomannomutase [uncultured Psychrobacter sp.]|uniref:phosphomannomutase n=1 Tax=uncultured Psychrobacter sp. TaxID=259303 RepID=UPI003457CB10
MSAFAAQQSLFRAYDIRGARQYFTTEFIEALGVAFAHLYLTQNHLIENSSSCQKNINSPIFNDFDSNNVVSSNTASDTRYNRIASKTIVIGYDVRCNSDTISQALTSILHAYGLTVIQLGLITTPMMAFWAQQYAGHGIMVTASHSEKNTLGIKWLVDNNSPSDVDIQTLYKSLLAIERSKVGEYKYNYYNRKHHDTLINQLETHYKQASSSSVISLPTDIVASTYIDEIAQIFTLIEQQNIKTNLNNQSVATKLDLTVVIDCMNGATSRIAQPLFENFCKSVIMLNDTPDGNFPTGNPDPTEINRLAELQQTVIINAADMGLAFDGDGDRLMIVDNSGKVVTPDHLLFLLAQVAMTERAISSKNNSDPQVIFDVKCSHHLPRLLKKLGAIPVMSKTGSSILRQQLQSQDSLAIFAGELSGHFIFNDDYFIVYDDAMYAGLRLLHWLASTVIESDIVTQLSANIKTNAHAGINSSAKTVVAPMLTHSILATTSTDLWGASRRATLPYRLTDITQYLPRLISTADNYLPLPDRSSSETASTCSIVDHMVVFCHYLQHLVKNPNAKPLSLSVAFTVADLPKEIAKTADFQALLSCACFDTIKQVTIAQARKLLPAGTLLSCIDGIRLDFAHGFGILRQSNTSHSLTVRFAGDSVADLQKVQARFVALCRYFDTQIAEQIAAIGYE